MLDAIGNDEIKEVIIVKSARVGYTKMLLASIGYHAHHKHRNQCIWQPTDEDADDFCKTELDPMLRDMPVMLSIFPAFLRRNKDNTLRQKKFLGSLLHIRGGKAAKNYRRLTLDAAYIDELDGFDLDIESEGSAIALSAKRIEGAIFPKHVLGSTPKLRGFSLIESRAQLSGHWFRFQIPCIHCGQYDELRFGAPESPSGFKWGKDDPATVMHLCAACGSLFSQSDYFRTWERGKWISQHGAYIDDAGKLRDADHVPIPWTRSVAFHIWTGYSPQASWSDIVRDFLAATAKAKAGDKSELKTFVNTTLGETWEEDAEQADKESLQRRAEPYPLRTVPLGGLMLVAGVDVQDNRFEVVVWAIGVGEEMWACDYTVLNANPADERDWERLDEYLSSTFLHEGGGKIKISATAIDSGGHFTHQTYGFCRSRTARRMFAVKGDMRQGQPVKGTSSKQDVNWRGKIIKRGVQLWHVGTDTAKDLLFGRLRVTQPGPGYVHFSNDLSADFFKQLTAEARMLQKTASGDQYRWVKREQRNEVLDCTVYALFASHMLDLHRYTDHMWEKLRAQLILDPELRKEVESAPMELVAHTVQQQRQNAPANRNRSTGWIPRRQGWLR